MSKLWNGHGGICWNIFPLIKNYSSVVHVNMYIKYIDKNVKIPNFHLNMIINDIANNYPIDDILYVLFSTVPTFKRDENILCYWVKLPFFHYDSKSAVPHYGCHVP